MHVSSIILYCFYAEKCMDLSYYTAFIHFSLQTCSYYTEYRLVLIHNILLCLLDLLHVHSSGPLLKFVLIFLHDHDSVPIKDKWRHENAFM